MAAFLKMIKYFWYLSFLLFLGFILLMYSALPDTMRLTLAEDGSQTLFFSKNTFFYVGLSLLVFLNITLNILAERMAFVPAPFILMPKKDFWLQDFKHRKELSTLLKDWMKGICLCINLFLLAVVGYIYSLNMEVYQVNTLWLIYLIPILIVVWKGVLVYWLGKGKN
jgi:hypothetical protein